MRVLSSLLAFVAAAAVVVAAAPVLAADPTVPHEHKGKLKPYPRPPKPLVLADTEKAVLLTGKPVMRQTEGEGGGRGLAVFVVNAPPDLAWSTIQDFKSYPKWIPEVKICDVYQKNGGKIDVHFQVASFPVTIDYYIRHDYDLANRWGTWTLDYDRQSDLDDSVGFWRVSPVEGSPDQAQVEYSVDIALKGWVPGFVRSILVDNGLKQATQWVKVQSEKRFKAQPKTTPAAPPAAIP
ncbi:MAG: SRPBCC family protein [Deltaproteobacteria bacterium]|nr:SRPBCC family protein [Deltaproteobacteria bacterium]